MLLDVTHAVVVFDEDGANERVDKYPGYKKNRDNNWETMKEEETPFSQEEDIKRAQSAANCGFSSMICFISLFEAVASHLPYAPQRS